MIRQGWVNPNVKLIVIWDKAHEKWNAGICKMKAYRARRPGLDLVDGSFKDQFLRLYDYSHELLRSNPNNTIKLTVQPTEQQPDQTGQPEEQIIGVDGFFLKGNYGGKIIAGVRRDPNYQMMPIALAVVEEETKDSWARFLELLVQDLGGQEVCKQFTFISDQQKGMLPAMEELLPEVEQRFCVRRLYNNFRKMFPSKPLKKLMWRAAKASYPQV